MVSKLFNTIIRFRKHNFSILANYGDLSIYNFNQMTIILTQWNRKLIEGNGYFDAEWECKNTRIRIRYSNSNNNFIQIIQEEWKPLKLIFSRRIIKEISI